MTRARGGRVWDIEEELHSPRSLKDNEVGWERDGSVNCLGKSSGLLLRSILTDPVDEMFSADPFKYPLFPDFFTVYDEYATKIKD